MSWHSTEKWAACLPRLPPQPDQRKNIVYIERHVRPRPQYFQSGASLTIVITEVGHSYDFCIKWQPIGCLVGWWVFGPSSDSLRVNSI